MLIHFHITGSIASLIVLLTHHIAIQTRHIRSTPEHHAVNLFILNSTRFGRHQSHSQQDSSECAGSRSNYVFTKAHRAHISSLL